MPGGRRLGQRALEGLPADRVEPARFPQPWSADQILGPRRPPEVGLAALSLLAAAAFGLLIGAAPSSAGIVLVVLAVGLLTLRLELAATAVVGLWPVAEALDDRAPLLMPALLVVLLVSWVVARSGGELVDVAPNRLALALAVAAIVVAAASLLGHGPGRSAVGLLAGRSVIGGINLGDLVREVGPVLVALVLVDGMRGRLGRRSLAWLVVLVAVLSASIATAAMVAGGFDPSYDSDDLAVHVVAAAPLLLALIGRRRPRMAALALIVLLIAPMLGVALGVTSPAVLLALAAMLLVAGVARLLDVRTLTGLVAIALITVGAAPLILGAVGADRAISPPIASGTLWPIGLVVMLGVVATAVVVTGLRWHRDRDRLAGAVLCSLVGVGLVAGLTGDLGALPLWLVVALAGSAELGNRMPALV